MPTIDDDQIYTQVYHEPVMIAWEQVTEQVKNTLRNNIRQQVLFRVADQIKQQISNKIIIQFESDKHPEA